MNDTTGRKVFLVHGRDADTRRAMEAFLKSLDLRVIPWEQAATWAGGGTPYTGDIVQAGMDGATAVVVLITPDDEGRLRPEYLQDRDGPHEREPTGQPRLNVVFEAGMAMAIDRQRVVLVEVGAVRRISDIDGVNVIRIDDTVERRRALATRLKAAGLAVDMDHDDWRTAGTFATPAVSISAATPLAKRNTARPSPGRSRSGKPEAYLAFWDLFLKRALSGTGPGWLRPKVPTSENYLVLESRRYGSYVVGFVSGRRLRAELYIDTGELHENVRLFKALRDRRADIEHAFGAPLSWEELPERRACRVAIYRDGEVLDLPAHGEFATWFLDKTTRLRTVLDPWLP